MPQPAIDHLKRIPTIVLDPHITHTSKLARVHITTAPQGIAAPGTAYRMDEIPMPLKPALKSPYPSDEEVVRLKQDGDAAEAALRRLIEERPREEEVFKEQVKAATGEQLDALLASHLQQSQARQAEYDAALAVRDGKVRKAALAEQLLMAERDSLAKRARAAATEERLRDELHECEVAARAEADCRARFLAA